MAVGTSIGACFSRSIVRRAIGQRPMTAARIRYSGLELRECEPVSTQRAAGRASGGFAARDLIGWLKLAPRNYVKENDR